MASLQALGAAAQDRKARLAQLKSLKRKQSDTPEEQHEVTPAPPSKSPRHDTAANDSEITTRYLSGRNYDAESRGAKLGFDNAPNEGRETLEKKAAALAAETKRHAEEEQNSNQPLDLFKLQPKKPNWDLKRDLDRKLHVLNVRTDNAIARLVRERISGQQKSAQVKAAQVGPNGNGSLNDGQQQQSGDVEAMGIEGTTLVEATNVRERENEEEARREREEDEALLDGR